MTFDDSRFYPGDLLLDEVCHAIFPRTGKFFPPFQLPLIGSALFIEARQLNRDNAAMFGRIPDNTPERTASLFAEYRLQSVPRFSGARRPGAWGRALRGQAAHQYGNQTFMDDYAILSLNARYVTRIAGKADHEQG